MRTLTLLTTVALTGAILATTPARAAETTATVATGEPSDATTPLAVDWDVRVPMRDGVTLSVNVYRPLRPDGRLPVLLHLTPYGADGGHVRATRFARGGYVAVVADCRGRGNSDGRFAPTGHNEARDAHDLVEWLARQPWSDGRVAMWGGSYTGFDQWAAVRELPPSLATIVPVAAWLPGADGPLYRNIFRPYELQWALLVSGRMPNRQLFDDDAFWDEVWWRHYRSGAAFESLPQAFGTVRLDDFAPYFGHPTLDAFWDETAPRAEQFAQLSIPVLSITGYYDGNQPGTLHYHREHLRHASAEAHARHFLVIGPWDHAGTRRPAREVGGLEFGPASVIDTDALHLQWYDWVLKGGNRPEFLQRRVAYYVTGAEEWRYADDLDSIPTRVLRLRLGADGDARLAQPGRLGERREGRDASSTFVHDPLAPTPAETDRELVEHYLTDRRHLEHLGDSAVVYEGAPLSEPLEITGSPRLTVHLSMDVRDTDLRASVYEVTADGRSLLLTEDVLRARHRRSLRSEELVVPGRIEPYVFEGFAFFSRRLASGSRVRLVLQGLNSIHWQRNFNGGGVVSRETARDARTARVRVHHDARRDSVLELPVVEGVAARR